MAIEKTASTAFGHVKTSSIAAPAAQSSDGAALASEVVKSFGCVYTVTLSGSNELIHGRDELEAYRRNGVDEVPAIVTKASGAQLLLLKLCLAKGGADGNIVEQGQMVHQLVNVHGMKSAAVAASLKVSKTWVSKRLSLAASLDASALRMVEGGLVSPQSAYEISKLPGDVQARFAASTSDFSAREVAYLVRRYLGAAGGDVKLDILGRPRFHLQGAGKSKGSRPSSPERAVSDYAAAASSAAMALEDLLCRADRGSIMGCSANLSRLMAQMSTLSKLLAGFLQDWPS
jgi:hypothetical protein